MALARYVSEPFDLPIQERMSEATRIDLEFHGVDHSSSSFEARVFINNPEADESTAREVDAGYAGSFFVFGHGRCFGSIGHCEVPRGSAGPYDRRPPHKLIPQKHLVILRDAILQRVWEPSDGSMQVTVVPVASESPVDAEDNLFKFERLALLTYES